MAKKRQRTKQVSKGERNMLARSTRNALRRDRRDNPTPSMMLASSEHRRSIISRPKDKTVAQLRDRYLEEERIKNRANDLFRKFESKGVTWAACVQAVKTDWVAQFENKWSER